MKTLLIIRNCTLTTLATFALINISLTYIASVSTEPIVFLYYRRKHSFKSWVQRGRPLCPLQFSLCWNLLSLQSLCSAIPSCLMRFVFLHWVVFD